MEKQITALGAFDLAFNFAKQLRLQDWLFIYGLYSINLIVGFALGPAIVSNFFVSFLVNFYLIRRYGGILSLSDIFFKAEKASIVAVFIRFIMGFLFLFCSIAIFPLLSLLLYYLFKKMALSAAIFLVFACFLCYFLLKMYCFMPYLVDGETVVGALRKSWQATHGYIITIILYSILQSLLFLFFWFLSSIFIAQNFAFLIAPIQHIMYIALACALQKKLDLSYISA